MKVGFQIWHISDFTRLILPVCILKSQELSIPVKISHLNCRHFTEVHLSTTIIFDHIKSETNKRKVEIYCDRVIY